MYVYMDTHMFFQKNIIDLYVPAQKVIDIKDRMNKTIFASNFFIFKVKNRISILKRNLKMFNRVIKNFSFNRPSSVLRKSNKANTKG